VRLLYTVSPGIAIHHPSYSATTNFTLNITTLAGKFLIPLFGSSIILDGRQSKVIVTDYAFGKSRALYSTAQVFYAGIIDGRDILFLHGNPNQEHEAALNLGGIPNLRHRRSNLVTLSETSTTRDIVVSFLPGIEGLVTVWDSDTQLILYADSETAATFWSPVIASKDNEPFKIYGGLVTHDSILVGGPYLVRSAEISGSSLGLRGDLKTDVRLTVIAPRYVRSITWNGEPISADVAASSRLTLSGGFVGKLSARTASATGISVPELSGWKYQDSLPEIGNEFDDAAWVTANKTTTNIPSKPYYGDGRVLYGCDYGLCVGSILYCFDVLIYGYRCLAVKMSSYGVAISRRRGLRRVSTFQSMEAKVDRCPEIILSCLILHYESAFAASVWLNDVFLDTSFGKQVLKSSVAFIDKLISLVTVRRITGTRSKRQMLNLTSPMVL
jgi:hypothetical protein